MEPDWNQDFLDIIDAFAVEGVEYLVVGAFALAAHGVLRASGDIDFFARPSQENAARLHAALRRFGAPLAAANVTGKDFEEPGTVYQIGVPPRRIDILTEISGVSFEDAWTSKIVRVIEGRSIPFIGRAALLRNKRATGRSKDLLDVDTLERTPWKETERK